MDLKFIESESPTMNAFNKRFEALEKAAVYSDGKLTDLDGKDIPRGITMDAADRRYLLQSGGMVSGPLMLSASAMFLNGASLMGSLTIQSAYGGESALITGMGQPGEPPTLFLMGQTTPSVIIRGVSAPVEDTDAVNKAYLDSAIGDINAILDEINGVVA